MHIRSYHMQFPAGGNVVIETYWSVVPVKSNDIVLKYAAVNENELL